MRVLLGLLLLSGCIVQSEDPIDDPDLEGPAETPCEAACGEDDPAPGLREPPEETEAPGPPPEAEEPDPVEPEEPEEPGPPPEVPLIRHLLALSTHISPRQPFLFAADLKIEADGVELLLTPLDANRRPVGETRSARDRVGAGGELELAYSDLIIPGAANPVTGGELRVQLGLRGALGDGLICGTLADAEVDRPPVGQITGTWAAYPDRELAGPPQVACPEPPLEGDGNLWSRIDYASAPATRQQAQGMGCETVGANNGSGMAGLLQLTAVELEEHFVEDEIVLMEFEGLAAGRGTTYLHRGEGAGDTLGRLPTRYGPPLSTLPNTLRFPLPVLDARVAPLSLHAVTLSGRLSQGRGGLSLHDGLLTGYVGREALLDLIRDYSALCAGDDRPPNCEQTAPIFQDGAEAVLPLLIQFMGGFDTRLEGHEPIPCDPVVPGHCNAVSLCLALEARPIPTP